MIESAGWWWNVVQCDVMVLGETLTFPRQISLGGKKLLLLFPRGNCIIANTFAFFPYLLPLNHFTSGWENFPLKQDTGSMLACFLSCNACLMDH